MPGAAPPAPAERELSLLDLMHVLWRRKTLIAAIVVTGVGMTVAALAVLPRTYVARTLLLIDPDRGDQGDTASALAAQSLDTATIDSQVQLLGSRSLARDVVLGLGLKDNGELNANAPSLGIGITPYFQNLLGSAEAQVQELPLGEPSSNGGDDGPKALVVDRFLERLSVGREGKTYVISIAYASQDGELAARIANGVAEYYLVGQLAQKYASARRNAERLSDRLTQAKTQQETDQEALRAFRSANIAAQADRTGREGEQLVQLNRELVDASVERQAKETKFGRIREMARRGEITAPMDEIGPSVMLSQLNALKAQAMRREAELAAQFGDKHPRIIDARREVHELGARIDMEQQAFLREYEASVQVARAREQALQRELSRIKERSAEQDGAIIQLRALEQQADLSRRLYETLLAKSEAGAPADGMQRPDARVISEAITPSSPVFPRPRLIMGVALTISLIVALIAVYLAELADRGFRTASEIQSELGLANLGMLPALRRRKEDPTPEAYVLDRPQSRLAEAVRSVLADLLVERGSGQARVVMVTSCLPGEGKTTLSLCLARLAAAEGMRTLLIDADLRHPRVHELFGPKLLPGLGELLRGEVSLDACLKLDDRTGLVVMPGSKRLSQPARLLGEEGIGRILERARSAFDLIVIDTAPLLAVADARLIAPHTDAALLVVRWQHTPRTLVQSCLASLQPIRGKLKGAVLSRVDLKRQARYGYGDTPWEQLRLAGYYAD